MPVSVRRYPSVFASHGCVAFAGRRLPIRLTLQPRYALFAFPVFCADPGMTRCPRRDFSALLLQMREDGAL
jgi:hypothetical protein